MRVTGRVPLVDQELITIPSTWVHPGFFSGVRVAQSQISSVVFCRLLIFLLLFILLRLSVSDYPFGIVKILFLKLSTPSQARRNLEPNFTKQPPAPNIFIRIDY